MAKKRKKPAPYWWFGPETVDALRERLNAAGPGARLEVRIDAKRSMTLQVVAAGTGITASVAPTADPLNKSNICPPICP